MNSIKDWTVSNTCVLLRCDLNVPLNSDGYIIDNTRLLASVDTIKYLLSCNATVVIMSHMGRPDGKFVQNLSLEKVCNELSKLVDHKVHFIRNIASEQSVNTVKNAKLGSLFMLENLRFHEGEEAGDDNFAQILSNYGTSFVNDAFACSHRAHASITSITKYLPSFAGLNLLNEVDSIDKIIRNSGKCLSIIGGSKISSKINLIESMMKYSKTIVIGGAMANTFLLAKNYQIGLSLVEKNYVNQAKEILEKAESLGVEIILPVDVVVSKSSKIANQTRVIDISSIEKDDFILDLGFQTLKLIEKKVFGISSIIWNGPLGMYEVPPFNTSSMALAQIISYYTKFSNVKSIVGGGDAVACAKLSGMAENFSFVSTAGGAFLEYLESFSLPGTDVLKYKIEA